MNHRLPSIGDRLARALVGWSIAWSVAMSAAVWLAASHEVDELLDETMQSSAQFLAALVEHGQVPAVVEASTRAASRHHDQGEFSWQIVSAGGALLARSARAPSTSFHATPREGFFMTRDWRVYGRSLGADGRQLYVAHTLEERREAQAEVALNAALAALAIGLLGHFWLRSRAGRELQPLQALSARLAGHDPLQAGETLGPAPRAELQPVHDAIDELGRRLARRLAHERAFTAHAAHSLRTPLAGIDAQLAMALRECPTDMAPRLQRVRDAAGRLNRVVEALLSLFRSGTALRREPVDLAVLLARLPAEGLAVEVDARHPVNADADLLAAALINLLDNALRHGATHLHATTPAPDVVRLHDDGPGLPPERRAELQRALARQEYEGRTGLGLMLADLVARSHGGRLEILDVASGFAVDMVLGETAS